MFEGSEKFFIPTAQVSRTSRQTFASLAVGPQQRKAAKSSQILQPMLEPAKVCQLQLTNDKIQLWT